MTDLCLEYGIHRQTGYEMLERYEQAGIEGLLPRSRAPKHTPHRTSDELVQFLLAGRRAHPSWGAKKLKQVLEAQHDIVLPAPSTIGDILARNGLIERKRRRRRFPPVTAGLREATEPNALWCADYKGQFRVGDGSYCYPLTVTDQFSRKLLCCEGMAAIDEDAACEASVRTFRKYGLPAAIRTDNGAPFASRGLAGLTRLSVLWLRLGIELERITPGQPQQNGRHERMHRTLKRDTARPAGANLLQQQERFEAFVDEFNDVRPHEALGLRPPSSVYEPSSRKMPERLAPLEYPLHDDVLTVSRGGTVSFGMRERYYLCPALAGQEVGVRELEEGKWVVTFAALDLGNIDRKSRSFTPGSSAQPRAQQ
jgi:transposase InsO family protein